MATLIPVEGEITLTPVPKNQAAVEALLDLAAGSGDFIIRPVRSGEVFLLCEQSLPINKRACRFALNRGLDGIFLCGPVVLLSLEEGIEFDLHMTAERSNRARATQIVTSLANAVQSGAITMLGVSSGSGKTSSMIPAGALPPVVVQGNTFPVKDQLKALGGKWDPVSRAWTVPADKAAEAQALVAQHARPAPQSNRPNQKMGRCVACGCRVDAGAGVLTYVANSWGGGKWVVNCAPADQVMCDARRQSLRKGRTVKTERQYETERKRAAWRELPKQLGLDKLQSTSTMLPSIGSGPNGWTKIAETLDYPETRLYAGTAPTGETIYCEHRVYSDEDRILYYSPRSVAVVAWEARAKQEGITGEAAREWLVNYRGCVGDEFYEYLAQSQPQGV